MGVCCFAEKGHKSIPISEKHTVDTKSFKDQDKCHDVTRGSRQCHILPPDAKDKAQKPTDNRKADLSWQLAPKHQAIVKYNKAWSWIPACSILQSCILWTSVVTFVSQSCLWWFTFWEVLSLTSPFIRGTPITTNRFVNAALGGNGLSKLFIIHKQFRHGHMLWVDHSWQNCFRLRP